MAFAHSGQGSEKRADKGEGDHEGRFLRAFEEYADVLFRHANIRVNDRERAVELVHDTFTKVWGYLREGHEIVAFRSFLYKVLNNLIIDEYRHRRETSLDAILEAEGVDEGMFAELREEPLEALINALDAKQAFLVLRELPDIYRESITLRFVDGLAPKEIAGLIEETENVVSVRLHRGVNMLREKIAKRIAGKTKHTAD